MGATASWELYHKLIICNGGKIDSWLRYNYAFIRWILHALYIYLYTFDDLGNFIGKRGYTIHEASVLAFSWCSIGFFTNDINMRAQSLMVEKTFSNDGGRDCWIGMSFASQGILSMLWFVKIVAQILGQGTLNLLNGPYLIRFALQVRCRPDVLCNNVISRSFFRDLWREQVHYYVLSLKSFLFTCFVS